MDGGDSIFIDAEEKLVCNVYVKLPSNGVGGMLLVNLLSRRFYWWSYHKYINLQWYYVMLSPRQGGSNGGLIKSGFISINRVNNELIDCIYYNVDTYDFIFKFIFK